jgi:hypothetical protein
MVVGSDLAALILVFSFAGKVTSEASGSATFFSVRMPVFGS